MLESPFGEKFYFRTALSLKACKDRLDEHASSGLIEFNFSQRPVSVRRGNRFWLYENSFGNPPSLIGKLRPNLGWTEIIGRGGSNRLAFWSAVGTCILFAGLGGYAFFFERDRSGIGLLAGSIPAALLIYLRFWEDPGAEKLIDYLQQLLEAEQMPMRRKPSDR